MLLDGGQQASAASGLPNRRDVAGEEDRRGVFRGGEVVARPAVLFRA